MTVPGLTEPPALKAPMGSKVGFKLVDGGKVTIDLKHEVEGFHKVQTFGDKKEVGTGIRMKDGRVFLVEVPYLQFARMMQESGKQ